ncbi:ion channel [Paenibacillus sp. N1-5-1-14]|uniref:potassium channel family protein n=1 Tax=Paenibacillus radicibacter TaxID=2972488 RepID=UPI0021597E22|nr:potassium channel family protein [Paenibacillus radicibacter]MCR8644321.1 ion channel [Paenibacillus radicibacter]
MYLITKLLLQFVRLNNRFIIFFALLFIVLCSLLAFQLEPETFKTRFNSFWWVMTTVTTVGYGDFYPHTVAGKWLGIFVYLFGIGLISLTISKIIDAMFIYHKKKEEGKLQYMGEQHFVIIEWSKHAENAIQEILESDPKVEVVLIDSLEKTPFNDIRVHYIQGNPVHLDTLEKANMAKARAVFIFADEVTRYQNTIRDPAFIDGKTLLIATTIEKNYSNVYSIVEIRDRENLENFRHIQVNEFILSSEMVSQLAVRSAFNPGSTKLLSQLLTRTYGDDLYEIPSNPNWNTFHDAFTDLLNQGATLISDGTNLNINRRLTEQIPADARLFVICDRETYENLLLIAKK